MCVIQAIRLTTQLGFNMPQVREVLKAKERLAIFDAAKSITNACCFGYVSDIVCGLFGIDSSARSN
jgi:hypothetical protein